MATRVAIAVMRDKALERITDAAAIISAELGVETAALSDHNRDPDYLHAAQLGALADWAERIAEAVQRSSEEVLIEGNSHVTKTQDSKSRR